MIIEKKNLYLILVDVIKIDFFLRLEYSNKIQMLIIEFHWIDKDENKFIKSVKKLKKEFEIVHVHANNHLQTLENGLPIIIEMTLVNKKLIVNKGEFVNNFPVKNLDFPNNPLLEDINFSFED